MRIDRRKSPHLLLERWTHDLSISENRKVMAATLDRGSKAQSQVCFNK